MAVVLAECQVCGTRTVPCDTVTVVIDPVGVSRCAWTCPECGTRTVLTVPEPDAYDLAFRGANVRVLPTPTGRRVTGPPIHETDLTRFVTALTREPFPARAAESVRT